MIKDKLPVKLGATREVEREFLYSLHSKSMDKHMPDDSVIQELKPKGKKFDYVFMDEADNFKPSSPFTDDSAERKNYPVYSGCLAYFPDAIAEVCKLSKEGNDKHNPGEPLHWSRYKSNDHKDCIARHLMDGDWVELAWRALANAQVEIEKGYKR